MISDDEVDLINEQEKRSVRKRTSTLKALPFPWAKQVTGRLH